MLQRTNWIPQGDRQSLEPIIWHRGARGNDEKSSWFKNLKEDKIRLKHLACETSLNGPREPTNESKISSKVKRCFDTDEKYTSQNIVRKLKKTRSPCWFRPLVES